MLVLAVLKRVSLHDVVRSAPREERVLAEAVVKGVYFLPMSGGYFLSYADPYAQRGYMYFFCSYLVIYIATPPSYPSI